MTGKAPLLLVAALLVGTLAVHGQGDAVPEWTILLADAKLDATANGPGAFLSPDPRVDITQVAVRETAHGVEFRFWTREVLENATEASYTSRLDLRFLTADGASIPFTADFQGDDGRAVATGGQAVVSRFLGGSTAWNWTLEVLWSPVGPEPGIVAAGTSILEASAEVISAGMVATQSDRAPDTGTAGNYRIRGDALPDGNPVLPLWAERTGPDFAAGPDVAAGPDGLVHVAYIVYSADRGTEKGLYHATVAPDRYGEDEGPGALTAEPAWTAERVADATMPTELHEDGNTQIALAVDENGKAHIVFHPHPNADGTGEARYATNGGGGWTVEDPASLSDGTRLSVDDSYRGVPDVASSKGRTIAALQLEGESVALVERGGAGWTLLERLNGARHAKIALDADGKAHVAWLSPTSDQSPNRGVYGDLLYASERDGWAPVTIANEIEDLSKFWETAEADGSFAFALAPDGTPHFVWENDADEQGYTILAPQGPMTEPAPLIPGHGNFATRMRMALDAAGNAHIAAGYGGLDLYAIRSPTGGWMVDPERRIDVFTLAVFPDGHAVLAGTQPHGGTTVTTLFASQRGSAPGDPDPVDPDEPGNVTTEKARDDLAFVPLPGFLIAIGALLAVGFLGGGTVAAADRRPAWVWHPLAAVAGFSRLTKKKVLDHETRDQILHVVRADPGRPASEVRNDLGIPRSTFFYHLRRMEEEGVLRVARSKGQLFLYGEDQPVPRRTERTLRPLERELLKLARDHPRGTTAEYADLVGRDPRTVHENLQRLARKRLLDKHSVNPREVRWVPGSQEAPDAAG